MLGAGSEENQEPHGGQNKPGFPEGGGAPHKCPSREDSELRQELPPSGPGGARTAQRSRSSVYTVSGLTGP